VKKLLVPLLAALFMFGAVPAHSDPIIEGAVCQNIYNSPHTKAVRICARIAHNTTANHPYWSQLYIAGINGFAKPWSVTIVRLRFWSTNDHVTYCNGYLPCTANDNQGTGQVINDNVSIPSTTDTDHYPQGTHRCFVHAYTDVVVFWNSQGANDGDVDWNSGEVNSSPWCS
jgi:hypothetical protein